MINCGFTPPNCLKDLCKCPVGSAKSNATKGTEAEAGGEDLSTFAQAFERGRKEVMSSGEVA